MSAKTKTTKPNPKPKTDRASIIAPLLMRGGTPEEISKIATVKAKGQVRTDAKDVVFLGNILVKCGVLSRDKKGIYKRV